MNMHSFRLGSPWADTRSFDNPRSMADDSPDKSPREKVEPSIQYLQKLGSKHLDLIFEASKWVFSVDDIAGLDIFVADIDEVESLPRHAVSLHLQNNASREVYEKYLEHIIQNLHEDGPEFHERLVEIYMDEVERYDELGRRSSEMADNGSYTKLLNLLESSTQYRADRLLGRIPDGKMYEVRAILLGRLGQHDGALQIYVYQLGDHARAEE